MELYLSENSFDSAEDLISSFLNPNLISLDPIEYMKRDLKITFSECCNEEFYFDKINAILVCEKCGSCKSEMVLKTWKNEEKYMIKKKETEKYVTFINFLNRFSCVKTNIDPEIIEMFREIKPKSEKEVREILKRKKLNKILNQSRYIWFRVSKNRILISTEERTLVIQYFKKISDTYIRLVQNGILKRKNIWLYLFVLLKILEELNFYHIINQMDVKKILINPKNIILYNSEWKIMCDELKIKFIKY